jgi:hypothetical protein
VLHDGMGWSRITPMAFGLLVALGAEDARACGGLFCSAASPVNQAAERIIFARDESAGRVTAVIEILYQGPAERFAWILPVAGSPTVSVSTNSVLNRLQQATNPVYRVQRTWPDSSCQRPNFGGSGGSFGGGGSGGGGGSVSIVSSGNAGPYDYQVISVAAAPLADPAQDAVDWLMQNGYDTGATGPDLLRPYLMNGLNLLAVRLSKQASVGSIRPIKLSYDGAEPMIPIRPTAVAANDDMGILVWVLGSARAVPFNYKALELNEALIDWFNPQQSYNDVVIAAANETGDGQGFVTELARPTVDPERGNISDLFLSEQSVISGYRSVADGLSNHELITWVIEGFASFGGFSFSGPFGAAAAPGRVSFDGVADALARHLVLPEGVAVADVLAAPRCHFEEFMNGEAFYCEGRPAPPQPISLVDFDRTAFMAAVEELVIQPIEQTVQLFVDFPYLTRFYTTLSADEMTVDPLFAFNPDIADVDNQHLLALEYSDGCLGDTSGPWQANVGGRIVRGEGTTWPLTIADRDEEMPANLRILQLSTSGQGAIYQDNGELIGELLTNQFGGADPTGAGGAGSGDPNAGGRARSSGGCSVAAMPAALDGGLAAVGLLLSAGAVAFRRRR